MASNPGCFDVEKVRDEIFHSRPKNIWMTIKFIGATLKVLREKGRKCEFEFLADKSIECLQNNFELKKEMVLDIIECGFEIECANMLKYYLELDKILQQDNSIVAKELRMNILITIEGACRRTQHHKIALESALKAENIAQELGDKRGKATCCESLGNVYFCLAEYEKAISYYQKGLEISTKIGYQSGIANSNGNLGSAYDSLGEHQKAIGYHEESLSFATAIGDLSAMAGINGNLGNAYVSLGHYEKAILFLQDGLNISIEIGDRLGIASINRNLGIAYFRSGDYQKAIEYYQKGLAISDEIGNMFEIAQNNGNLGNVYYKLGEYEKAIKYHEKVLAISTEIRDFSGTAKSNGNLGNAYFSLGEYERSIEYYKKSLEIIVEIGERSGMATVVGNLGNAYYRLGNYERAIRYYEEGLTISTEIGDRSGIARSNGNLGNAYQSLGEYERAITYHKEGRKVSTVVGDRSTIANINGNLGTSYLRLKQYEKAIKLLRKGLKISVEIGNPIVENACLRNIGLTYFCQGCSKIEKLESCKLLQDAASYLKRSVICVDQILSSLDVDQNKISFSKDHFQAYVMLMSCFILLKRIETALLVIDLGKAKALHAFMEKQKKSENDDMVDYTYKTWESIDNNAEKMQIEEIKRALNLKADNSSVLFFSFDLDEFLNFWIVNGEGDVKTFKQNDALFLKESIFVQSKKLLSYLVVNLSRHSFIHKLDSDFTSPWQIVTPIQMTRNTPSEKDQSCGNTCPNNTSEPAVSPQVILQTLYQVLVHPVKRFIKGTKLIIVPDEFLFFVPFCSLLDENGCGLFENYSFQIAPSLHTLVSSITRLRDSSLGFALFVGNPTVGKVSLHGENIEPSVLYSAAQEVKCLAPFFEAQPLVGDEATKETVLKFIQGASVIHIAAHGEPELGEILLSPPRKVTEPRLSVPEEDSYLLRQQDIMSMKVSAHLVVLCCCHTGQGELSSEGVIGLTRAFLAAGARSVLATLWRIHDEGTKEFMKIFYDEICQGTSVCEALRRSMSMFQKHQNKDFRSFKIWAPFTIYGEDVKFTQHDIEEIKQQSRTMYS